MLLYSRGMIINYTFSLTQCIYLLFIFLFFLFFGFDAKPNTPKWCTVYFLEKCRRFSSIDFVW